MAMECATFTSELADLLAGPFDGTDPIRRARVAALARHAADCGACRGAAALVELAAVAPGARDPLAEPGSEFWSSFGHRLDARVEAEEDRAGRVRRLRRVAAAVVLLAFGALVCRSLRREDALTPLHLAESRDPRWRLGLRAEEAAAAYLAERGYEIRARRFRVRAGEIDIVANDGEVLVFVEVKARATRGFGMPAERVNGPKRSRIARAAAAYLASTGQHDRVCRFDVVELEAGPGGDRVRHFPDAFRLGGGRRSGRGG
jgi:putative endonuclease